MSGRILIIPSALVLDKQFPARTIRLWLVLQASARHKDDEGNLVNMRDRREIAEELDSSYQTVSDALVKLQEAGWLKIDRIPGAFGRQVTLFETQQVPVSPTKQNENQAPAEI